MKLKFAMNLSRILSSRLLCLVAGLLAAWLPTTSKPVLAQSTVVADQATGKKAAGQPGEDWVRIVRNDKGKPLALEVAIVRYVPADFSKQQAAAADDYVDLIGAIHIADSKYYRQLNKKFQGYDAVLYELVAPEGTVIERGRGTSNTNPLGAMQNGMSSMLELEHQLEKVDYTRPNFVHADLSPEEFSQSMEQRDEGFTKLAFRIIGQSIAQQSQQAAQGDSTEMDIFAALFAKNRPLKLKIAMAKQFESMESMLGTFSGPDGSTLITVRNKRALEVLRRELVSGKQKLGIFYGAGHLPDMHKRLLDDFGMKAVGVTWIEAWDLRGK